MKQALFLEYIGITGKIFNRYPSPGNRYHLSTCDLLVKYVSPGKKT